MSWGMRWSSKRAVGGVDPIILQAKAHQWIPQGTMQPGDRVTLQFPLRRYHHGKQDGVMIIILVSPANGGDGWSLDQR